MSSHVHDICLDFFSHYKITSYNILRLWEVENLTGSFVSSPSQRTKRSSNCWIKVQRWTASSSDYSSRADPPECRAKLTAAIKAPNTFRINSCVSWIFLFFFRNRCFPIDFVIRLTTVSTKCSVDRILRTTQTRLTEKIKRLQALLD